MYPHLGKNWINDNNISILAVGGKTEFWKYRKKLNELHIRGYIIADFDFFLRQINEFLTQAYPRGYEKVDKLLDKINGLKSKIIQPKFEAPPEIDDIAQDLISKVIELGYKLSIKDVYHKIKEEVKLKKLSDIQEIFHEEIRDIQSDLKSIGVYFLDGELEDLYSTEAIESLKTISGKEEKPIHLVSNLLTDSTPITHFIDCSKYFSFFEHYCSNLGLLHQSE